MWVCYRALVLCMFHLSQMVTIANGGGEFGYCMIANNLFCLSMLAVLCATTWLLTNWHYSIFKRTRILVSLGAVERNMSFCGQASLKSILPYRLRFFNIPLWLVPRGVTHPFLCIFFQWNQSSWQVYIIPCPVCLILRCLLMIDAKIQLLSHIQAKWLTFEKWLILQSKQYIESKQ